MRDDRSLRRLELTLLALALVVLGLVFLGLEQSQQTEEPRAVPTQPR